MGKTVKDREYSFNHCVERAAQRYGIVLTKPLWEAWSSRCRTDILMSKLHPGCTASKCIIHTNTNKDIIQTTHVFYEYGTKILAVFENKRDCITTLLPPEKNIHFAGRMMDKPRYCKICSDVHRSTERCS